MKNFQIFEHLVHIPSLAQYVRLDSKTLGKTLAVVPGCVVHWISSWVVWGLGTSMVHVTLPKWPINQFKPVSELTVPSNINNVILFKLPPYSGNCNQISANYWSPNQFERLPTTMGSKYFWSTCIFLLERTKMILCLIYVFLTWNFLCLGFKNVNLFCIFFLFSMKTQMGFHESFHPFVLFMTNAYKENT